MQTIVTKLLKQNDRQYEKMVFNHFHQWCARKAYDSDDVQLLISSQALFAWWQKLYHDYERKFVKRAIEFASIADVQTFRDLHAEYVAQTQKYFSRPLMAAARKRKIINPQLN